jgi:hypothetical protein
METRTKSTSKFANSALFICFMFTVQNFVVICVVVVSWFYSILFSENTKRKQGTPTIHRTAGVGVIFLIWIIVSISGICPSQAPA